MSGRKKGTLLLMSYTIRKTRPEDEAAVGRICFLTFDNGEDERYRELAGLHWTAPYLRYEPENCFVIVDKDDVPVGYVLAATDARFSDPQAGLEATCQTPTAVARRADRQSGLRRELSSGKPCRRKF